MPAIRAFRIGDEDEVIALWDRCGLTRPWNDPALDVARKLQVQPEMFFVATIDDRVIGSVMAGYDGHRGWLYYVGVDPDHQRAGIGRALVQHAEEALRALGCPKLNLLVRRENHAAAEFYVSLGYTENDVVSYGRLLDED